MYNLLLDENYECSETVPIRRTVGLSDRPMPINRTNPSPAVRIAGWLSTSLRLTLHSRRLGFILDELSLREPRNRADTLSVSLCVFEATEPI